jgi:stress-induced morphogen
MSFIEAIKVKLQTELQATHIEIVDNTWMHAGHAGSAGGAHLKITVVSPVFEAVPLIDQHRLVQDTLKTEMQTNAIHALELKTFRASAWQPA